MPLTKTAITFLGTGTSQGVPVIGCRCNVCTSADLRDHRLRTSALVSVNGLNLLIDTGPDLRQQMLRSGTSRIDAVLFTHAHSDHLAGLDDVRPFNFMQRRHMPLYGGTNTLTVIRKMFSYAFDKEPYPGAPMLETIEVDPYKPFHVNGVQVIPLPVEHSGMPTMGFRIGGLSYITDAKSVPACSRALIRHSDVLILNALRNDSHHSHLTLEEALSIVADVRPGRTFLTHISHQLGVHEAVSRKLPEHVALAYDGLVVEVCGSAP